MTARQPTTTQRDPPGVRTEAIDLGGLPGEATLTTGSVPLPGERPTLTEHLALPRQTGRLFSALQRDAAGYLYPDGSFLQHDAVIPTTRQLARTPIGVSGLAGDFTLDNRACFEGTATSGVPMGDTVSRRAPLDTTVGHRNLVGMHGGDPEQSQSQTNIHTSPFEVTGNLTVTQQSAQGPGVVLDQTVQHTLFGKTPRGPGLPEAARQLAGTPTGPPK